MSIYTDTQRLKAAIYATGHTPTTFAKAMGIDPRTMKKEIEGRENWSIDTIERFGKAMETASTDYQRSDLEAIFFPRKIRRSDFAKPYALAVIEIGLGITEEEAAEKAGITLEALRSLYNACRTDEQLKAAYGVWEALGLSGKWGSFYHTFLDYQDTPKA